MSQELLYTSAPHGLKPGSRGFCTVLSTQGMAAPLASALEGLSGYRPAFPPGDEQTDLNPVNWSHVTLPVAGRTWHILSRIAEYGLDYSQRTNKLAHHVVLDSAELIAAGPAALLTNPGFMRAEWNEDPHLAPPKPVHKIPPLPRGVCQAWKDLTGDAGWAGVLAESFMRDPERPVILLYAPGQEMLPLIAEALSLIPADRRWDVTFSTYFTGLPQSVNCNWRCMLSGSPEAHQSLRFVRALRLDLTNPDGLGIPAGNELVADARGVPRLKAGLQGTLPPLPSAINNENSIDSRDSIDDECESSDVVPALPSRAVYELRPSIGPFTKRTDEQYVERHAAARDRWKVTVFKTLGIGLIVMMVIGLVYGIISSFRTQLQSPVAEEKVSVPRQLGVAPRVQEDRKSSNQALEMPLKQRLTGTEKKLELPSTVDTTSAIARKPDTNHAVVTGSALLDVALQKPELKQLPNVPDSEQLVKTQLGRHKVTIDTWDKHSVKILAKLTSAERPVREPVLWSPEIMYLNLQKPRKDKSTFALTEGSREFEFGSITWKSAEASRELKGLQLYNLNLVSEAGPSLSERLKWCEIDIKLDDTGDSSRTVCFHPFPCARKDVAVGVADFQVDRSPWEIQWKLEIRTDSSHLPTILSDGIALIAGDQQFKFKLTESIKVKDDEQTLKLTDQSFKNWIKRPLLDNHSQNSAESVFLKVATKVDAKENGESAPVLITVSLQGMANVQNRFKQQRESAGQALEKSRKELAKLNPKNKKPPRNSSDQTKKAGLIDQAQMVISDVDAGLDVLSQSTEPEPLKMKKKEVFNRLKADSNMIIENERLISSIEADLKLIRIKSVSLYYELKNSSNRDSRRVQIFVNDGK